jgi:hypothetical protein
MNFVISYFKKHKVKCIFILSVFLFLTLVAGACDNGDPVQTTLTLRNDSSTTVKIIIHFKDEATSAILAPGSQVHRSISDADSYTAVVKPMGDWLAIAKAKRDRLVGALALARETGKIEDIKAIVSELRSVTDTIANIVAASTIRSCAGSRVGNTDVTVLNGSLEHSVVVVCGAGYEL